MGARRKPERKSTPPESRATRRQDKRPQLCKHCAASVRRRNCRSSLCFVENLLDQRLKTRLVANAVVDLVNFKIPTRAVLLLVRFFQPIQTFFFLAKSKIDRRERCWTDVLPFRQLFEFAEDALALRAFPGEGKRGAG